MTLGEGVEQLAVFSVFCVLGAAFCSAYVFGYRLFKSKLPSVIFDAVFGAFFLYAVIAVNLAVNNGEFRLFVFVGLAVGAVISFLTVKSTLDKLGDALYNLFTEKLADKSDGKDIQQQKSGDSVHSGDSGFGSAALHAVGDADANGVAEPTRRKAKRLDRRGKKRRNKKSRASGIHEDG